MKILVKSRNIVKKILVPLTLIDNYDNNDSTNYR